MASEVDRALDKMNIIQKGESALTQNSMFFGRRNPV
jgi:hypothetical protein